VTLDKYQARRKILAKRRVTPVEEQQAAALAVAQNILSIHTTADDVVALYSPIQGEVPTEHILNALQAKGIKVAYPYAMINGSMRFKLFNGAFASDDLGIPVATGDEVQPNIIFTPLVAFDRAGNRLGYGKGYYDKALEQLALASSRPIRTIGLAYSWQEVPPLTPALHDVPLDQIWTENEVITCQPKSR
tara:strand:- start:471791 stop:472360 length:570 start_codon:yes stop_codon:yes gene_type:complete